MNEYSDLIKLYRKTFGEGASIFDMLEEEAIKLMKEAIETGKKIKQGAEKDIPKDAYL